MTWVLRVGTSLTVGLILTLVIAIASLLWTMFTTHPGDPRALAFFGALFFEAKENPQGGLALGMGLENAVPLIAGFLIVSALSFAVTVVVARLRAYRQSLAAQPAE